MKQAIFAIWILTTVLPAYAADKSGEFFVRGVGGQTCEIYVLEKSKNSATYYLFRSWLNGYISAYNEVADSTYAIAPTAGINGLASMLETYCRDQPEQVFSTATSATLSSFKPLRLRERSEIIALTVGDRRVTIFLSTIQRVQQVLSERGYLRGTIDGVFGPQTRAAIKAFQRDQKLTVTGLPDEQTISKLLP